jgi:hypothetical protein
MSQRAFLQDFDTTAFEAFLSAGLADEALYTPPGGAAAVACQVLVDRNLRDYGEGATTVGTAYTLVTFHRSQVDPQRGARVVVDPAGAANAFLLDAEVKRDESMSRWVVTRV